MSSSVVHRKMRDAAVNAMKFEIVGLLLFFFLSFFLSFLFLSFFFPFSLFFPQTHPHFFFAAFLWLVP